MHVMKTSFRFRSPKWSWRRRPSGGPTSKSGQDGDDEEEKDIEMGAFAVLPGFLATMQCCQVSTSMRMRVETTQVSQKCNLALLRLQIGKWPKA